MEKELEKTEETKPSNRDAFMNRFRERYEDVDSDDEEAFYGKLGEEMDRLDKSDKDLKDFSELIGRDPRTVGFLMVLKRGENPVNYLLEHYGEDFRAALEDESKAEEFAEAVSKHIEKVSKDASLREEAEKNLQGMLDDLEAAQEEGTFSDEQAVEAYEFLYGEGGLLDRVIKNAVTKDDWLMLMKASDYDRMKQTGEAEAEEARREGEIAGRNATIDMNKRKRTQASRMPSNPGGGSAVSPKPKDKGLEVLEGIVNRKKSIWE